MRCSKVVGVAIGLALCSGTAVAAPAANQRPCVEFVKKFCPGTPAGTPKAFACLAEHMADLSDACKERVEKMKDGKGARPMKGPGSAKGGGPFTGGPAMLAACKAELDKNCKDIKPGGGRLVECLKAHEKDLGDGCKAALPKQK